MDQALDEAAVRFLSLASHDLRGPLGTVRSYAALLCSPRFSLDPRVRSAVEAMLRNVDRALGSWDLLAEAWRLDIGGLRLELRDEDLLPPLRSSTDSAAISARTRGIQLEVKLPASLPRVRVDGDRIQLALAAALSHIVERSHAGATAGVTARPDPAGCVVTFWDTGAPLTPDEEGHAFDRRWHATRGHELGSGFRMAIAGALVQAHGGRAEVGSLNGRTLFHFFLPSRPDPDRAA